MSQHEAYAISGWDADYKTLKHLRYIRNQLAHESGTMQQHMCDEEDIARIDGFRNSILSGRDPLTCAAKNRKAARHSKTAGSNAGNRKPAKNNHQPRAKRNIEPQRSGELSIAWVIIIFIVIIVGCILILRN